MTVKWFLDRAAFWPPLLLAFGVFFDIFIGQSHPFALILGSTLGTIVDPLLLFASLAAGLIMKPSWHALVVALIIGATAEAMNMNNQLRVYEGREGFNAAIWLMRSLGSCSVIALLGAVKMAWARLVLNKKNEGTSEGI